MPPIRIEVLNHGDQAVAQGIHAVQMVAYAQEAKLLEAKHFPPLERSVEEIQSASAYFFGALSAGSIVGALELEPDVQVGITRIASLVVVPQSQRQGIAGLLLAAALATYEDCKITVSTGAMNSRALAL